MIQELLSKKKQAISDLEERLKERVKLNYELNVEKLAIVEEKDEKGKQKFSNELKREVELMERKTKQMKRRDELDIIIEITRLSIEALTQEISILHTTKKVIEGK